MKSLFKSLIYVLVLLMPLFLYMQWSLETQFGMFTLIVLFGLLIVFPFIKYEATMLQLAYFGMGVLSYLFIFCLLKDLLRLFGIQIEAFWVYPLTIFTVLIGWLTARSGPRLQSVSVNYDELPRELEGLTICQISDLHIGPNVGKEYVERIVNLVNRQNPDVVVMTGDIGDGPIAKYKNHTLPLANLKSKYGVFYVPGNHEYYWGANQWLSAMNALGAVILVNRFKIITVEGIRLLIAGVPDPVSPLPPDPSIAFKTENNASFKILLSHRPALADSAASLGYNLQLSGHTHGGQFFPWTIAVRFFHRRVQGLHRVGSMWLYINSGTATWGPTLRLGTYSEITLLTFRSASFKSLEYLL